MHDFGDFALKHLWHGAVASEVDDGTHRSFWARHRSHDARSGGVMLVVLMAEQGLSRGRGDRRAASWYENA